MAGFRFSVGIALLVLLLGCPCGQSSVLSDLDFINKLTKKRDSVSLALMKARKMHEQAQVALKQVKKQASKSGWEDVQINLGHQGTISTADKAKSMLSLKKLLHQLKKKQLALLGQQNQAQLELEDLMNASAEGEGETAALIRASMKSPHGAKMVESVVKVKQILQQAVNQAQKALKLRSRSVDYVLRLRLLVQQQIHRLSADKVHVLLTRPERKVRSVGLHVKKHMDAQPDGN